MKRGTDVVAMLLFMSIHVNVKIISCSGKIEIQIDHVYNIYGTLMNGSCCEGMRSVSNRDFCTGTCRTYLIFCVGDVLSKKDCKYGKIVTPVLGRHKNTIRFPITKDVGKQLIRDQVNKLSNSNREDVNENIFRNLLTFIIPNEPYYDYRSSLLGQKGYYIKMEARHRNSENTSSPDPLISQQTYPLHYKPHNVWRTEPYNQRGADVIFHSRVSCDRYYYQATCQRHCKEHQDMNFNWRCLADGTKECLPGWKGILCDEPICNQTCNSKYGCIRPNVCGCPFGYQGKNCDKCIVDPTCVNARCRTAYQCLCKKGWGGRKCHIDLDICRYKQCENGGTCIPNQDMDLGGYTCQCVPGFGGKNCSEVISPCHSNPCLNNGVCKDSSDGRHYTCHCPKGTSGRNCEKDIQYCTSKPCHNSGKCIEKFDGYECACPSGWQGLNCSIERNECASNPCVNARHCKDLFDDYYCSCRAGWSGKQCHVDINDCKGQCRNNATCVDKVNDYLCQCKPGYSGKQCEHNINDCAVNPCSHDGICVDLVGSFKCICKTGYYGAQCEKQINLCDSQPCRNNANCTQLRNDYHCACPAQWVGKQCTVQSDSEKHCKVRICKHNSTCEIGETGAEFCKCKEGYTGAHCEIDRDDCTNVTCSNSGICVDRVANYECVCQPGFTGRNCDVNIDECASKPCHNGGVCSDGNNTYTCACVKGFQGFDCSSNIDECAQTVCRNGGTCVDGLNSFTCECRPFYYGKHCETGPDYCHHKPCGHHGNCSQGNGTFSCSCHAGYTGRTCEENIDDCVPNPCHNGGVCVDKVNSFACKCAIGHHGDICQYNDTCVAQPCQHGGECVNQGNDYHCQCPRDHFGKDCNQVESKCYIPRYLNKAKNMTTMVSSGYCSEHGTCRPHQGGGFTCDCMDGWTGERCQLRMDYCINNNCKNMATCLNSEGGYKCACANGFTGIYCQINTDDCVSAPCQNGGKCSDQQNDFLCECRHGWKGKTCSSKLSSCAYPNPCQNDGHCVEKGDDFRCSCKKNYVGKTCNVFVGPCDTNRCLNGGTCLSNMTSYQCQCRLGFWGQHCEHETKECAVKPCLNNGKCVEGPMMYNCECKPGYHGANCQFEIDECAHLPCPRGMECVDKVATYECVCPQGRTGKNCEEVIPLDFCQVGETIRKHNESWENCCNKCTCVHGNVQCSDKQSGPRNCYQKRKENCTCVAKLDADCITPPCDSWGECEVKVAPVATGRCMPDVGRDQLNMNCAKVVIVFHRNLLPQGLHMERICEEFRYLDVSQTYAERSELKLLCIRSIMNSNINAFNVSVDSKLNAAMVALELAKKFASIRPEEKTLYSMLRAMVNVTVERHVHWSPLKQDTFGSSFLIPLAAGTALFALVLLVVVIIYALKRCKKAKKLKRRRTEIQFFTKKKNDFQKTMVKNTNRERSLTKGDPHCELLNPNMYFEGSGKKFLPLALHPRDEIVV